MHPNARMVRNPGTADSERKARSTAPWVASRLRGSFLRTGDAALVAPKPVDAGTTRERSRGHYARVVQWPRNRRRHRRACRVSARRLRQPRSRSATRPLGADDEFLRDLAEHRTRRPFGPAPSTRWLDGPRLCSVQCDTVGPRTATRRNEPREGSDLGSRGNPEQLGRHVQDAAVTNAPVSGSTRRSGDAPWLAR